MLTDRAYYVMNNQTDLQLIAEVLEGSRQAANCLTERYRAPVFAIARKALGNADDAADVTQEALIYALFHLPELHDVSKFASWLHSVTLSHCVDYRRRRGTRRLGEPITLLNEASEEANYVESLALRQSLAHLSEAQRATLLLHYEGGWSLEEVGGLLHIPINTVRSRLMAAKRNLRADLRQTIEHLEKRKPMTATLPNLNASYLALVNAAFPGARVVSVQTNPEPWMPFNPRLRLEFAGGAEKTVDIRGDISPERAALLPILEQMGIPVPRLVYGPTANAAGKGWLCLCEVPRGENLLLWTLGGTPHRIRLATERAFEAIDRLQGATDALLASPAGAKLERRTLLTELDTLTSDERWQADRWLAEAGQYRQEWQQDEWFRAALSKVRAAVQDIQAPLAFTDYLHFFPNFVRVQPAADRFNEPLGWPGDARYQENPLAEIVSPFGHIGDPLLGLAMVWVYDCYPFVHTGYVEQFLWRRGVSKREFAPRLAIKALQMIARDLPVQRPEDGSYWDSLRGWAEQALAWM